MIAPISSRRVDDLEEKLFFNRSTFFRRRRWTAIVSRTNQMVADF
ncbi:MAG: hypothetical protein Q7K40_04050 [bacterium]|nr:hypothetical protein [bacterium]